MILLFVCLIHLADPGDAAHPGSDDTPTPAATIQPAHICSQVAGKCFFSQCPSSSKATCIFLDCVCTGADQCAVNGVCTKPAADRCVDKGGKVQKPIFSRIEYSDDWKDAVGRSCSFYASSTNVTEATAGAVSRLALSLLDYSSANYVYSEPEKAFKVTTILSLIAVILSQMTNQCPTESFQGLSTLIVGDLNKTSSNVGDFNMTANEACCACGGGSRSTQVSAVRAALLSIYDATDGPGWLHNYGCDTLH